MSKQHFSLLPLVMCMILSVSPLEFSPIACFNVENIWKVNEVIRDLLFRSASYSSWPASLCCIANVFNIEVKL